MAHIPPITRHRSTIRRPRVRLSVFLAVILGSVLTGLAGPAPAAHATALAMQCDFHEINVVFPTPLTHAGQSLAGAEVDSTLSDCNPLGVVLDPVFAGVKTAHFDHGRITSGTTTACLGPAVTFTSQGTGTWVFENAAGNVVVQGIFPFEVTLGPGGSALFVAEGKFTSGPLQNYTGHHLPVALVPNGLCQTGGITALKSVGTANFRSP